MPVLSDEIKALPEDQQVKVGEAMASLLMEKILQICGVEELMTDLMLLLSRTGLPIPIIHEKLTKLAEQPPEWLPTHWRMVALSALEEYESETFPTPARSMDFWRNQTKDPDFSPSVVWVAMLRAAKENGDIPAAFKDLNAICLATGENGTHSLLGICAWVSDEIVHGDGKLRELFREHCSDLPCGIRATLNQWFLAGGILPPWPEVVSQEDYEKRLKKRISPEDAAQFEIMRNPSVIIG